MDNRIYFVKNLVQLVLAPTKGWEDVSASQLDPHRIAVKCMYPLFVLAALTVFFQLIYHPDYYVSYYVIKASVIFVSYFVTYIFASMIFENKMGSYVDGKPNNMKMQTVIVYGLSLLAISTIICNFIPVTLGLTVLFPLGISLILWKSATYMFVKETKNVNYAFLVLLAIAAPPVAIQMVFEWILNA